MATSYDENAYQRFLSALSEDRSVVQAARQAGLTPSTIAARRACNPAFDELVKSVLNATGRGDPLDGDGRDRLLQELRTGAPLPQAAQAARVTLQRIKRRRYADPAFDAAVVEAARAAGTSRFKPLVKPPCPGPKCGTTYGYDMLGCREAGCRDARVAKVTAAQRAGSRSQAEIDDGRRRQRDRLARDAGFLSWEHAIQQTRGLTIKEAAAKLGTGFSTIRKYRSEITSA